MFYPPITDLQPTRVSLLIPKTAKKFQMVMSLPRRYKENPLKSLAF